MGSAGTNGFQMRRLAAVTANDAGGNAGVDDGGDDDGDGDGDGDIYIMMECLSVCVSRKMITSSWESPVTT